MKHISHVLRDTGSLKSILASSEICSEAHQAQSILIQIYCAKVDSSWIGDLVDIIRLHLPTAVIVGATTVGEVADGHTLTGQTVIGFSFFRSSTLASFDLACAPGEELLTGRQLDSLINQNGKNIAGVLLLATTLSIDAVGVLSGLENTRRAYPVFGGGASDYGAMVNSLVFSGSICHSQGVVALALCGTDLHIESRTYLGWRALSKEMTINETDGMWVKIIDGKPAFDVYRRYLAIPNDDRFFLNTLEFPFLLERNGEVLARVPVAASADGTIQFVADINAGERFRIGYGDPAMIIHDARAIRQTVQRFAPEAVFLYSCSCRRFLMQQDVEFETLPFEAIAPTFGFYTYGEFYGRSDKLHLLNATMVVVGIREGAASQNTSAHAETSMPEKTEIDPFANQHTRVVGHLIHFIGTVTKELEDANVELQRLALIDKLTQTYNRMKLDEVLAGEITRASRYYLHFSVILVDVDHFKHVNDTYGHIMGDAVLVRIAEILKKMSAKRIFSDAGAARSFCWCCPRRSWIKP